MLKCRSPSQFFNTTLVEYRCASNNTNIINVLWILKLNFNKIKSIESLENLTNLTELCLQSNEIQSIKGLGKMIKLKIFDSKKALFKF